MSSAVWDKPPPERILVVKPGSMGDVIHALPVVAALKNAWPATEISWLIDQRWEPLLAGNPNLARTIIFPRERFRGPSGLLRAIPWMSSLADAKPDLCIDLQGLLRSATMAKFSGAPQIVGLSDAREGAGLFYSDTATVETNEHSVLRYLRVLEVLGLPAPTIPEFWLPQGTLPPGVPQEPYLLLHPFARGQGKSLAPEVLNALCDALSPRKIVLAGGPSPAAPQASHITNLLGKTTLPELTALIRQAIFMISVDSGPAHIAAAVGTPLLAIHTWSNPQTVGPFNESSWLWQGGEIRRQKRTGDAPLPRQEPNVDDAKIIAAHVLAVR
ncbi:MAG: glycosyltransferase family 9 protein [Terrimicrobiaceae bacterium]